MVSSTHDFSEIQHSVRFQKAGVEWTCVVRGPCPYGIVVLRKPEPHPSCSTEAIWRSREKGQTYLRPRVTFDDFEIEAKSAVESVLEPQ
jgi:hypothetical protein